MNCLRLNCDLSKPDSVDNCCKKIIEVINHEGVWISPTNTIYGISGNGLSHKTYNRIQEIKGRSNQPFLMLVKDIRIAEKYAFIDKNIPKNLNKYFEEGIITIIFESKIETTGEKIALRIASDIISKKIFEKVDIPIISTSANISGEIYVDNSVVIYEKFCDKTDLIIDSGKLGNSVPSTIIDVTGWKPAIIRKGYMFERIENALI